MGLPEFVSSGLSREQAITDLISSVAMQEAAIGGILRAEEEKIQAFVAAAGTTQAQLLAVNSSVQRLVSTIARLESILLAKLELFSECACTAEEDEED